MNQERAATRGCARVNVKARMADEGGKEKTAGTVGLIVLSLIGLFVWRSCRTTEFEAAQKAESQGEYAKAYQLYAQTLADKLPITQVDSEGLGKAIVEWSIAKAKTPPAEHLQKSAAKLSDL